MSASCHCTGTGSPRCAGRGRRLINDDEGLAYGRQLTLPRKLALPACATHRLRPGSRLVIAPP